MSGIPIGARITYQYVGTSVPEDRTFEGYVSLGQYDEDEDTDTYGIADDQIFYYSTQDELIEMLTDPNKLGYRSVIGFRLVSIDEWVFRSDND